MPTRGCMASISNHWHTPRPKIDRATPGSNAELHTTLQAADTLAAFASFGQNTTARARSWEFVLHALITECADAFDAFVSDCKCFCCGFFFSAVLGNHASLILLACLAFVLRGVAESAVLC